MIRSRRQIQKAKPFPGAMNLLLVDDDDIALLNYRIIAGSAGYFSSVRSARNGRDAVDILSKAEKGLYPFPDVILLDFETPVVDVITFLKILKKWDVPKTNETAIVLVFDHDFQKPNEATNDLGLIYFLRKPISFESFDEIVAIIAGKKSNTVQHYKSFLRP